MTAKVATTSEPIFNENLARLQAVFPNFVRDGQVDFDALQAFLKNDGVLADGEKYGLNWAGKSNAFRAIRTPSTGTLVPQPEESKNWDNTENLFIEGDNLEVLKLLQKQYREKIKMIYIDPPYNTGKDFVYKDNFTQGVADYYEQTGQTKGGIKMTTNTEKNGRYHSDWLTMMYPRLFLARNLLRDDGVIFVSIDDNEVANLRLIMDEIFGEENFVEAYIWESTFRPDNSSDLERENGQYVLLYAKNKSKLSKLYGPQIERVGLPTLTKNSMNISVLKFPPGSVQTNLKDGKYEKFNSDTTYSLLDDVEVKGGEILNEFRLSGRMIWSQQYLEDQIASGTKILIKNKSFVPYSIKTNVNILPPTTIIPNYIVGDVLEGRAEVANLIGAGIFDYPKPISLVTYLINYLQDREGIVLDFFAGSGTTAHAVMGLNVEDGGNRKWICVQLPEVTEEDSEAAEAGYKTIAEISRERIRRAGEKIGKGDIGFKSYKLSQSNYRQWQNLTDENDEEDLKKQVKLFMEKPLVDNYDEMSVVYEILVKEGFSLNSFIKEPERNGKLPLWMVVDEGERSKKMAITFAEKVTPEDVAKTGIGETDNEIFVCFDSALDDTGKVNVGRIINLKTI